MNSRNSKKMAVLMLILSGLSFFAAARGVFDQALYYDVYQAGTMPHNLIWGSQAQDMMSMLFSLLLAACTLLFLKKQSVKLYIMMLGLTWYFFYAFGLYTMQGQYTSIYFVYLAIFGVAFYGFLFGTCSIDPLEAERYQLPEGLRKAIFLYLLAMIGVLYPVWILRMLPDVARHIPCSTYGVFILDLGFIFPAMGWIAYMLWKRKPRGTILAGVAIFKIFALCLSWALAEISNPFVGNAFVMETALISFTLTLSSLACIIPYFMKLKKK